MPVSYAGFHLKPVSFFDGNPALDMPRSTPACHAGGETSGDTAAGDACCGSETGESARGQVAE
jgi:primary-amine oxidase